MYFVIFVMFTCNKLFNFTGLETFILTYHFRMRLCEVTQRITTGVIPLEASLSTKQKGLTSAVLFLVNLILWQAR